MNAVMIVSNILFYLGSTVVSVWFYLKLLHARYTGQRTAAAMTLAILASYLPTFFEIYRMSERAEAAIDCV